VSYDEFLTILLGGAIAGGVGIVTTWYGQRLADKRRLNEETLEPTFNYVHGLPAMWPWLSLGEPVWKQFERHRWYRIPVGVRRELRELEVRIDQHAKLIQRYWELLRVSGDQSFGTSARRALSGLLSPDNQSVRGQAVGVDPQVTIQVQDLVNGVVPFVLMCPAAEAEAWKLLDSVGSDRYYWAKQAIRGLQKVDPSTLTKLFEAIVTDPSESVALPIVQSAYEAFGRVVQQANLVRYDLAPRLGLKEPREA
jgi:hypothetical protein